MLLFPHLTLLCSQLLCLSPLPAAFSPSLTSISPVPLAGLRGSAGPSRGANRTGHAQPGQPRPLLTPQPRCCAWAQAPHVFPKAKRRCKAHVDSLQTLSWARDHTSCYFRSNYEAVLLACKGGTISFQTSRAKPPSGLVQKRVRPNCHTPTPAHLRRLLQLPLLFFLHLSSLCTEKSGNNHN